MDQSISKFYIFDGMDPETVTAFLEGSNTVMLPEWQTIISEGDTSNEKAYILLSGSVEVVRAGHSKIAELSAPSLFGEIALVTNEPRTATIRTTSICRILVIQQEAFLEFLKTDPKWEEVRAEILRRIRENFTMDRN